MNATMDNMMETMMMESETADLQQSYRAAFQNFAGKEQRVLTLKQQIATGERSGMESVCELEAAVVELERARIAYSKTRDELAKQLLPGAIRSEEVLSSAGERQLRLLAHLLWESAGRPEGTAEEDWHHAEKLAAQAQACVAA